MDSTTDMRGQKKIFNKREDKSIESTPSKEQTEKNKCKGLHFWLTKGRSDGRNAEHFLK